MILEVMQQFAIHNGQGFYIPKTNNGTWTKQLKYAKKYLNKPAMFKKLLWIMERYPKEEFFFEALTLEIKSKGSQTLGAYNRIKKVKTITKNIEKNENSKEHIS